MAKTDGYIWVQSKGNGAVEQPYEGHSNQHITAFARINPSFPNPYQIRSLDALLRPFFPTSRSIRHSIHESIRKFWGN